MGRDRKNEEHREHWTKMLRSTMETPAWRALGATSQSLYPWLKMEWKGPKANNNGKISLPVRVAADRLGCNMKTAGRAFHDLQAKGFLLLTQHGRMGTEGKGAAPTYEITELAMPGKDEHSGKKLYLHWEDGHDFAVRAHAPVNPAGRNGLLTAESKKTRPQKRDETMTTSPQKRDEPSPKLGRKPPVSAPLQSPKLGHPYLPLPSGMKGLRA